MRKLWRLIFSRYAISAFIIVGEIALIWYLILGATAIFTYVVMALAVAVNIITIVSIINRDANPEYKVTWLVVVLCVPLLGAFLYAIFYQRRISKREEKLLRGIFGEMNNHHLGRSNFDMLRRRSPLASGKARAIMHDDPIAEVYVNSRSTFFASGEKYFESLIFELKNAKKFIFLEYFIIASGELWDEIHAILVEKARAGVEVRVLYDDIGCMSTLPSRYEQTLRLEGIQAYRFSPISPKMSSVHNNRDHRKLCIIDGRVGYTGGVNIADEYVNKKERFGHWKDGGIQLRGEALRGLIKEFFTGWDLTARTVSDYGYYLDCVESVENGDGGYYLPFSSGPAPIYQRPVGKNAFLNLINQARNYVYITTPYLVIDYDMTEALCNAALRGVDVRIITPGIPDKKKVWIMTQSAYPYLMKSGVKIYEYTPGFIHEKCFVADDKYAVIGTINFDYRSLVHNYENAVWMYVSPTCLSVRDEFMQTLKHCRQIDENKCKLSIRDWIIRNGIRLFAPLL